MEKQKLVYECEYDRGDLDGRTVHLGRYVENEPGKAVMETHLTKSAVEKLLKELSVDDMDNLNESHIGLLIMADHFKIKPSLMYVKDDAIVAYVKARGVIGMDDLIEYDMQVAFEVHRRYLHERVFGDYQIPAGLVEFLEDGITSEEIPDEDGSPDEVELPIFGDPEGVLRMLEPVRRNLGPLVLFEDKSPIDDDDEYHYRNP